MTAGERHDVIIVGGGSSGCVLAARLSENPARKVLLLEAGPDFVALDDFPPELARAYSLASAVPGHPNNWDFVADLTPGRRYPLARGKVIGGSSAVNGTYFVRARPEDFDRWGLDLWTWEKVLPFYRRSENDADFGGDLHGADGPMPVRRTPEAAMLPVSKAFIDACRETGHPDDADKNALALVGVGPTPRNAESGSRLNAAVTYLAMARGRPNLTVLGKSLVRRVLFDGRRATGVEVDREGRREIFEGGEILLCASGIKSPHLLMLSGIGPAEAPRGHGISVVHDSPGVGRGVKDHPSIQVRFKLGAAQVAPPGEVAIFQASLNHSAPGTDMPGDIQILGGSATFRQLANPRDGSRLPFWLTRPVRTLKALSKLPFRVVFNEAIRQDSIMLVCSLEYSRSKGEISLSSADPAQAPRINLNYLSDPADLAAIRHNVRTAVALVRTKAFGRLKARLTWPREPALASDAALDMWIRANLGSSYHTSCSARMGPASDPMAVTDQHGRVHGVEGLRVADLSILPDIIRRGPAATAIMIGERIAALMEN